MILVLELSQTRQERVEPDDNCSDQIQKARTRSKGLRPDVKGLSPDVKSSDQVQRAQTRSKRLRPDVKSSDQV